MKKNRLRTIREIFSHGCVSDESINMRTTSVLIVSIENRDFLFKSVQADLKSPKD